MEEPRMSLEEVSLEEWRRWKEELKAQAPLFLFEGAVKDLESLCLQYAPDPDITPKRFSDGWHAREILLAIHMTRDHLERDRPRYAAAQAIRVGYLAGGWSAARQWRERQEARSRGGRAQKYLFGVQAVVDRLAAEHPKAAARELWNLIPESKDAHVIDGFMVYRDGSTVVQVDDKTGREKEVAYRSFPRYVKRARSK